MQERRSSLITNATFQLRWMVQAILASFILINAVLIVAFLVSGSGLGSPGDRLMLGLAVALTEVVGLFLIFRFARKHSNRIAGPVYRVRQVAQALAEGDLTSRARIREGDFFGEELATLDTAVTTLRERINGLRDAASRLQEGPPDQAAIKQLREQLGWFKTHQ